MMCGENTPGPETTGSGLRSKGKGSLFRTALLFAFLCPALIALADGPFFSSLSMRDGLPSNLVAAVAQDQYDFMWIGTGSGLARYDGYHFKQFRKTESEASLPANEISALLADGDYLWVGTWKGLARLNVRTFEITRIDLGHHDAIRVLCKDRLENAIWVGTSNGLLKLYLSDYHFRTYDAEQNNLSHNTVRAIYQDPDGNLWVGTYDQLNELTAHGTRFTNFDLKGDYKPALKNNLVLDIKPFAEGNDSLLWVGTETGLVLLNTMHGGYTRFGEDKTGISNEVVKCVYRDKENSIWLGTDFGLNVFNPASHACKAYFHNPEVPYSIANNVVWQIFEDRGGVLWFVTSNGLSRLNKSGNFYTYHPVMHMVGDQTIGNQVKSLLVTHNGIYWLATQHGALRIDPRTNAQTVFDTDVKGQHRIILNNVFALEEDSLGRIWIGTAGGINVWDEKTKRMAAITADGASGLTSNYIARFTRADDGSFWVSAWEGGLFRVANHFDDLQHIQFERVDELGTEKVVAGAGALWMVEYDELYRLDLDTHVREHIPSFGTAAGKRNINCIDFTGGRLWAGTFNALLEYVPESEEAIIHPLKSGTDIIIASIMQDHDGNIWAASNTALHKFYTTAQRSEIYPLDRNIPLRSFFYGCSAMTPDGKILFGGDNGFIVFSPGNVRPNQYAPGVYVTSLEVNHRPVDAFDTMQDQVILDRSISFADAITLKYANRSIAFEFSSLHYWEPAMNSYAYQLEGFDREWNYTSGSKNFAVYSNLSPGDYIFRVKGTNNYGVWSDQVASVAVTVNPPLLLNVWFITLYVIAGLAMVYYALRIYSARVSLRNELQIIRMQKAHADEIEQTKEEFFTNISHELRTPISLILSPIREALKRKKLEAQDEWLIEVAEKNSRRLLRLVNQILDFKKMETDALQLKPSPVEMVSFCSDLHQLFLDRAHRSQVNFQFETGMKNCVVHADQEKIESILYNLLSNAFKFTERGGSITLSLSVPMDSGTGIDKWLEIKVSDTGSGIAIEDQQRIFERFYQTKTGSRSDVGTGIGLTLVSEYTKLHHGTIVIASEPGVGSTFTVRIPLGKQFQSEEQLTQSIAVPSTDEIPAWATASKTSPEQEAEKPVVLIVEDNPEMVGLICESLKHKYRFLIASDGEEGWKQATNAQPDVIVSDVMMPVMDGVNLCRKLREDPATGHIGIILLTARNLAAQRIEGIRSGADAYITKPFDIELLDANIEHLLKRKTELAEYLYNELILQSAKNSDGESVDKKFIRKVGDLIEANISNPELSVEMLSKGIGLSSTHLYRKLKSLTRHSANEIIRKYRLKKASVLLRNKEGNISEIMYQVGFSSLSYFSKCFRKEFGSTPREYQQQANIPGQEADGVWI